MKKRFVSLFLIAVILLSSCAPASSSVPKTNDTLNLPKVLTPGATGKLSAQQAGSPDSNYSDKIDDFGLKLLKLCYNKEENTFISPVSVYMALSMLYNGTAGETETQLAQALGVTDRAELNEAMRSLQLYILAEREDTIMDTANSLWVDNDYQGNVEEKFITDLTDYYGAMMRSLDFSDAETVNIINNWITENTNGMIKDSLKEIDPYSVMFLINTIYFKAKWQTPFSKDATRKETFHAPTQDIEVDMMHTEKVFPKLVEDGLKMLALPYTDGSKMIVAVPDDLDGFIDGLSAEKWKEYMSKLESGTVMLSMPKVDIKTSMLASDMLPQMGVKDVFVPGTADLTGISATAKSEKLYVNSILHQAALKIDEEGTEAAAATVIEFRTMSMPIDLVEIKVDKPFFVAIVDDNAGIVFSGVVTTPVA